MKQITITLPDIDAGKFVQQLLDLNVTFTVATTVARDPLVLAAEPAAQPRLRNPADQRDPDFVQRGLKAAKTGVSTYVRSDRPGWHMQRLTPDGRTAMDVVEAKVHQIGGRRFQLDEIKALSAYSGFQPQTLQNQLQTLVAQGRVVKLGKRTYRENAGKRASPLPENGSVAAPSTASGPTASPDEAAIFVTGEGWRAPA